MSHKILIIDDDCNMLKLAKHNLEKEGYTVLTSDSGSEGLIMARKEMPDLLVVDLLLPKMDGYSVTRMLRYDEKFKRLPIIMLTGKTTDKGRDLGQQVGVDVFLSKPYQPAVLLEKIKELLKRGHV